MCQMHVAMARIMNVGTDLSMDSYACALNIRCVYYRRNRRRTIIIAFSHTKIRIFTKTNLFSKKNETVIKHMHRSICVFQSGTKKKTPHLSDQEIVTTDS